MIVTSDEAKKIYNLLPSNKQSFYYHPDYLMEDVKNKIGLEVCFFIIQEKENIFYHAFYKGKIPHKNKNLYDIQSPYGYGGPLIVGSKEFGENATKKYLKWCENNNILVEFMRFHPILENHLNYYGEILSNRETVYINLDVDSIFSNFRTRVKRGVKKAKSNNIEIVFSNEEKYIKHFKEIYNQLMESKKAEKNYFFDLEYYVNLLSHKECILGNAINAEGEIVAVALYFITNDLMEYHLGASNILGKESYANYLLMYEAALLGKEKNCSCLYLGGGNSVEEGNSLLYYKKGFSNEVRNYYIGYYIYDDIKYKELKKENNIKNNNILFYR
ncbi:hypothetical protein [Kurthia huakuii]|uniref:hypothetical protein n=1 Tax=Kurthia huakuii TaxID=1421019 RepID=UPI000495DC69|nr:hypothetical protein [Kurthia huakuii]MBM7700749.1 hypothetical protein [Kurthia huakuii]